MKHRSIAVLIAAIGFVAALSSTADARPERPLQVPNGLTFNCILCHTDAVGNGPVNDFGGQILAMGLDDNANVAQKKVVWSKIYNLDADGDGFTNGEELGDPDGTWLPGDPDPATDNIAAPADAEDFPTGMPRGIDTTMDEGCAVAPGHAGSTGLLFALTGLAGLALVLRRRD